jgi:hypothetical protein
MLKRRFLGALIVFGSVFILSLVRFESGAAAKTQDDPPQPSASVGAPTQPAGNTNRPPGAAADAAQTPTNLEMKDDYLTPTEINLTLMVIGLALAALVMQFLLLKKIPKLRAEDTLRVFGVTLILMGTLFFITAGYSSSQIAPAIGLFGTVAGYLLGRVDRKESEEKGKESENNA